MGIVLFDWKTSRTTKKVVRPLFTMVYLFDGYLTEPPFNAQGGLGKMGKLFGDQTEEIINELNEALAA